MIRTRTARRPRHAARAAALLLATAVAACSSGSSDAARSDSAAVASSATPAATVQPGNPSGTMSSDSAAGAAGTAATGTVAGSAGATGATATAVTGAMLDPNAASREELVAVPGMTAAAADALVAGRPYQTMTAVDQALAKHLGAAERKTVYARVWKPIDLNTAAGPEILLIPGVGARMRHEFEEYRPYRSMEQFRREIGKYVDKEEVARLERYVSIR